MKRDIAAGVCKRLLSFLDQYNIPYLFSGGSLLGIIREGDLIVDDTDIDLCTYVPYIPIIYSMKKQLLENELIITREIKGDKLLKSIKKGKNGKVYDVMAEKAKVRYLWRLSFNGTNENEGIDDDRDTLRWIDIYGMHWFPLLKQVEWRGIQVNLPIDPETVLTLVYHEWKTPVHRKNFVRPLSAEPIHFCTTLYCSTYGIENRNSQYLYLNNKEIENFTTIKDFCKHFSFMKELVKDSL